MQLSLPWTSTEESHMGDVAWSIIEATGMRVAVGLMEQDAHFICALVNNKSAREITPMPYEITVAK